MLDSSGSLLEEESTSGKFACGSSGSGFGGGNWAGGLIRIYGSIAVCSTVPGLRHDWEDTMAVSDATIFAWALGKAVLIVISSLGAVVGLAWIGLKRGLLK